MSRKRSRKSPSSAPRRVTAREPWALAPIWRDRLLLLALFVAVVVVFSPSFNAEFLAYDDPEYVTSNTDVQQGLNGQTIIWAFTTTRFANWLPMTWLSHLLDVQLYGLNPAGHHLTSVLLHACNSVMVLLLLRRIFPDRQILVACAAAAFAFHPTRVESVTWIAERKDVLCATFFLLTLIAYFHYAQKPNLARLLGVCATYALGLMSKTMIVTLPALLVAIDLWPLRRLATAREAENSSGQTPAAIPALPRWRLLLDKVPFALLAAVACWWTIRFQGEGLATSLHHELTFVQRANNAVVSVSRYIGHLAYPVNLLPFYPHPIDWPIAIVVASVCVLIGLSTLACVAARREPAVLLGWFWFVLMLLPVSGIVQAGQQAMADRYIYLPGIGIVIACIGLIHWIKATFRPSQAVRLGLGACGIAWLLALPILTIILQGHWTTNLSLFSYALRVDEANWIARNHVGTDLFSQGDYAASIEHHQRAVDLKADDARSRMYLAIASLRTQQFARAEAECRVLIRQNPRVTLVRSALAMALLRQNRVAEASAELKLAHEIDPADVEVLALWATSLLKEGKPAQAVEKAEAALKLVPDHPDARLALTEARQAATRPATALPMTP